jgi:hypothetical protein
MDSRIGEEEQRKSYPELESEIVALASYLSDEIAPMLVADAIERLLATPKAVAVTIHSWIGNQYSSPQPLPVRDYLFHAAKKLHLLVELELLDQEVLGEFMVSLYPMLLEICPEEDREALAANLRAIGHGQGLVTSAVERVHRPGGVGAEGRGEGPGTRPAAGITSGGTGGGGQHPEAASRVAKGLERLNLLLDRFDVPVSGPRKSVREADQKQALLAEIVSELTASSENEAQLRDQMGLVKDLGIGGSGSDLLQLLGRSLPDWVQPTGGEVEATPIKTMKRVVDLASTSGETQKRFFEFVNVAVKELNSGALGRAATLFFSAEQMVEAGAIDASTARIVKSQIFSRIDQEALRKELESEDNFRALAHVLNFFPQVSPGELLLELEVDQERDVRRFIISMLRVHGSATRVTVLKSLADAKSGQRSLPSHVEKELLNLLHSIPRNDGQEPDGLEHEILAHYSKIDGELAVVREAVRLLGETPGSRVETISIARVGEAERVLLGTRESHHAPEDVQGMLDQLVRDLGRRTSPTAWRCVVAHSLKRKAALGDTRRRLIELGGHNLADEPAVYQAILDCLRSELPLKLFIVTVAGKKRVDDVKRLMTALSGTDVPAVRQVFREIADRFRGKELSASAERALRRLSPDTEPSDLSAPLPTLAGDIALFGLPNLLQNLSDSNLTGELTIQCENQGATAKVELIEGQLNDAGYLGLEGATALYQLLERPLQGQFSFMSRQSEEINDGLDLVSILLEGMRRYDELTRAEAFVADETRLAATGTKPTLPSPDVDRQMARAVWARASKGIPALECEQVVDVDCYQVRTLLSHWVGENALRPVAPVPDGG